MELHYIKQQISEENEEALFLDGFDGDKDAFDDALVGIGERCGIISVAVYNADKIMDILVERYHMTSEEAIEWYEYNMLGAYVGDNTPIFIYDLRND